jgi:hypothetical protein
MLFGKRGRELNIQPEYDPRAEAINREVSEIRKSVKALEAQATVLLGRDYKASGKRDYGTDCGGY